MGLERLGLGHVGRIACLQAGELGGLGDEGKRVGVGVQAPVQLGRVEVQVLDAVAVGVVVEALAQFAQGVEAGVGEAERRRRRPRRAVQVVAVGRRHRPGPVASGQVAVDQEAGADLGRGVDVGLEMRVGRQFARVVVIEPAHPGTGRQHGGERGQVLLHRDVECRHPVAGAGRDPL